jgi:hypothetical protein
MNAFIAKWMFVPICALVMSVPARGNVLTNGSFESGLTGWTFTGNVLLRTTSDFPATDGQNMINFNGAQQAPNGTLSQIFPTVPGQKYSIAFDFGNWGNGNPVTQGLRVTLQGTTLLDQRDVIDSTINGSQSAAAVYNPFSYNFLADSGFTTLTFKDIAQGTDSSDGLLDNVRINASPAPLPSSVYAASAILFGIFCTKGLKTLIANRSTVLAS